MAQTAHGRVRRDVGDDVNVPAERVGDVEPVGSVECEVVGDGSVGIGSCVRRLGEAKGRLQRAGGQVVALHEAERLERRIEHASEERARLRVHEEARDPLHGTARREERRPRGASGRKHLDSTRRQAPGEKGPVGGDRDALGVEVGARQVQLGGVRRSGRCVDSSVGGGAWSGRTSRPTRPLRSLGPEGPGRPLRSLRSCRAGRPGGARASAARKEEGRSHGKCLRSIHVVPFVCTQEDRCREGRVRLSCQENAALQRRGRGQGYPCDRTRRGNA